MPPRSRRAVLRSAALVLSAIGAGCVTSDNSGTPTDGPATPTHTASTPTEDTPEPTEQFPPDIDERVQELPPGAPPLEPTGEWPSYRFDAGNTGANPDGSGLRDAETYWRLNAGRSATVADGTLYNTFGRDQDHRDLTFRDPATAAVETEAQLVNYGVNPPPVVANGRVFVTTFIEVFCFDAGTGEQLWRGPEMDGIQGRPTVADDAVLVNSGGFDGVDPQLRAFDAETGSERWRYDVGVETKSTPAVGDGLAFVCSGEGLHAVDLASGDEAFVISEERSRWSTPAFHDGTVYSVVPRGRDDRQELVAVDVDEETVLWRASVNDTGPPVVTDEVVYAAGSDGLVALDSDGGVVRSTAIDARPVGLVGDVLYAAYEGRVYALDATEELDRLWSIETESVQVSDTVGRYVHHVTPVDGAVYVSARDAFYGIGPA